MRPKLIVSFKQVVFYALIVAPLIALDIWLADTHSHIAEYIAAGVIIFAGIMLEGPLQRRYWP